MVGVVGAHVLIIILLLISTHKDALLRPGFLCFFISCAHAARINYAFVFPFFDVVFDNCCCSFFPFLHEKPKVRKEDPRWGVGRGRWLFLARKS